MASQPPEQQASAADLMATRLHGRAPTGVPSSSQPQGILASAEHWWPEAPECDQRHALRALSENLHSSSQAEDSQGWAVTTREKLVRCGNYTESYLSAGACDEKSREETERCG
ncbi:uncharacterized protein LOC124606933 [Schistocerca americana]|uniref:uncharacterized protein LOC124606933 n=1 Tax=Schistocerca americana TaxID=7009 RepID=UPI001F500381|nr:uncharacterized protein LOC124606933 [Schistocerca americana]